MNMLACRLNSASLMCSAGNVVPPASAFNIDASGALEEERCELYYYRFDITTFAITDEIALSSIPFEFPMTNMNGGRHVYGYFIRERSVPGSRGLPSRLSRQDGCPTACQRGFTTHATCCRLFGWNRKRLCTYVVMDLECT